MKMLMYIPVIVYQGGKTGQCIDNLCSVIEIVGSVPEIGFLMQFLPKPEKQDS